MTIENQGRPIEFELKPLQNSREGVHPIKKKRLLVGRSQACDIVLDHDDVTSIHAVIEVLPDSCRIYDMNSTNGTYINGIAVVSESFKLGDTIKFGSREYSFKNFEREALRPPPLDMLATPMPPVIDKAAKLPPSPGALKDTEQRKTAVYVPTVAYPLAKDPKAEFSEYIFEDEKDLYPIFKYDISKYAVEIIVLYQDRIYSVDYLPQNNGTYHLVGFAPKDHDLEYAYLNKNEKVPLVTVDNGQVLVHPLPSYDFLSLSDTNTKMGAGEIRLGKDDIFRFRNGDLQIFVRGDECPPKVASAPFFRRDSGDLKKYILLIFLLVAFFMGSLSFIEIDEEIEKEKVPERIAKILYKKKFKPVKSTAVAKTKKKPKKVQKAPVMAKTKPVEKTQPVKKVPKKVAKPAGKKGSKTAKKTGPVKKATPNKGPKNVVKDKVTPPKKVGKSASRKGGRTKSAKNNKKTKGRVDTYKSFNFSSTVSNLLTKGGSTSKYKAQSAGDGESGSPSVDSGSEAGATLKTATVSNNVGSLSGSARGKLDSSKGMDGLVDKKSIYTAGLPFKTVVLGGMDPDIIRKIIQDHIPQFRYCYQKELDVASSEFSGVVKLNFIIASSGRVSRAGVDSVSPLPAKVKGCVVNVLKGIKFPRPMGGGTVEVNQPFNFYPKRK